MTYTTYTDASGAYVNGVTPLSAANMNNLRNFCNAGWFDSAITSNGSGVLTASGFLTTGAFTNNLAGVNVNGGTSGSCTLYQDFVGNYKRVLIYMTNYRSGSSSQTIALPTSFTKGAIVRTGGIGVGGSGGMQLLASGVAQSLNIFTGLALAGGTTSAQNVIYVYSIGEFTGVFDTISFPVNTTSAHTAFAFLEGQ